MPFTLTSDKSVIFTNFDTDTLVRIRQEHFKGQPFIQKSGNSFSIKVPSIDSFLEYMSINIEGAFLTPDSLSSLIALLNRGEDISAKFVLNFIDFTKANDWMQLSRYNRSGASSEQATILLDAIEQAIITEQQLLAEEELTAPTLSLLPMSIRPVGAAELPAPARPLAPVYAALYATKPAPAGAGVAAEEETSPVEEETAPPRKKWSLKPKQ